MRIGFDLDDTIGNFSEVFLRYSTMFGKNLRTRSAGTSHHSTSSILKWSKKERESFYKLYIEDIAGSLTPIKGAKETLEKLKKDGHEIYIISSRSRNYYLRPFALTYNWLIKHDIPFDHLIVDAKDKVYACIDLKIDLYIDDNIDIVNSLHRSGIKSFLMTTPFNKRKRTNLKRVTFDSLYNEIKLIEASFDSFS